MIRSRDELTNFLAQFERLRGNRAFLIQPFLKDVATTGEHSLVFLNGKHSHSVLKKPKTGDWRVQDELGGSVQSIDCPDAVREFGERTFAILSKFLVDRFGDTGRSLLYCRMDVLPGYFMSEVELVEPELHFLDRRTMAGDPHALQLFYEGIANAVERHKRK